jgi:hypothetical protein
MMSRTATALVLGLCFVARVLAHEHHDEDIPAGQVISADPIVSLDDYRSGAEY